MISPSYPGAELARPIFADKKGYSGQSRTRRILSQGSRGHERRTQLRRLRFGQRLYRRTRGGGRKPAKEHEAGLQPQRRQMAGRAIAEAVFRIQHAAAVEDLLRRLDAEIGRA